MGYRFLCVRQVIGLNSFIDVSFCLSKTFDIFTRMYTILFYFEARYAVCQKSFIILLTSCIFTDVVTFMFIDNRIV